ncbi:hypothetical protein ACWCPI_02160 [Streptomyces sp. NPDC001920]
MAQATLATLAEYGADPGRQTATVHGFGSMGGAAARHLARAGVKVNAVVDRLGIVHDDRGLDVERLLAVRTPDGVVPRTALPAGSSTLPLAHWTEVPSDILVTAATSYAVHASNHGSLTCRYLVEAANVSVVPEAEAALTARGVTVVPDFLANSAANSWWWWTLFGDVSADPGQALAKIESTMHRLAHEVFAVVRTTGLTARQAATALAEERDTALRALEPADPLDG